MIIEIAEVKQIDGDRITVECETKSSCGHCQAKDNCGTASVSKAFPHRVHRFIVTNDMAVSKGDQVEIGITDKNVVVSAMVVYFLPLIVILIFMFFADYISLLLHLESEILVILSAFIGGIIGFYGAKAIAFKIEQRDDFKPKIVSILPSSDIIKQSRVD